MFPYLGNFADLALLLQRLMVAVIFADSGWRDLRDPAARSKDIGMSKGFTLFLGAAELAGALGEAFGVLTQLAALGLILLSLGAIQRKMFVWHTVCLAYGFLGQKRRRLVLRPPDDRHEPGHHHYRRRPICSAELKAPRIV